MKTIYISVKENSKIRLVGLDEGSVQCVEVKKVKMSFAGLHSYMILIMILEP